jgi:hypothetical protein
MLLTDMSVALEDATYSTKNLESSAVVTSVAFIPRKMNSFETLQLVS